MDVEFLKTILGWVRPARSVQEATFIDWLEFYLETMGYEYSQDAYGNVWVEHGSATTLFTCHTDTCHSPSITDMTQELVEDIGILTLADPRPGYVLGADCGTGVFIMLEMLRLEVQGSYVFYRCEEIGGLGSLWSAENEPKRYSQYLHAVAFDRKGSTSIITHQFGERCCSQEFAEELGRCLGLTPDAGGTFTDTANLTSLVPECTNLSVGYGSQHTCYEYQDLAFLPDYIQRLTQVDWASLPVVRNVDEVEGWGLTPTSAEVEGRSTGDLWQVAEDIERYGETYAAEIVYGDPELAVELLTYLCNGD